MKKWITSLAHGVCSYDSAHRWGPGVRIFQVQGSTWIKKFCAGCAKARHGAAEDTGDDVEVIDEPAHIKPLKALADAVAARFDPKMRAANDQ